MDYEKPPRRALEASTAAYWIITVWRPDFLDDDGSINEERMSDLRRYASGGEGVMLDVIDSLTNGTPFRLTQLHRLGDWHRQVVLDALASLV